MQSIIQKEQVFDKIEYLGKEYFIKGRMSTGYAVLMNIKGKRIDFSNREILNTKNVYELCSYLISTMNFVSKYHPTSTNS